LHEKRHQKNAFIASNAFFPPVRTTFLFQVILQDTFVQSDMFFTFSKYTRKIEKQN